MFLRRLARKNMAAILFRSACYVPICAVVCCVSGRVDRIRTCDICVPNAALYQTEPQPEKSTYILAQIKRFYHFQQAVFAPF